MGFASFGINLERDIFVYKSLKLGQGAFLMGRRNIFDPFLFCAFFWGSLIQD